MQLAQYISDLLYRYDCVIVPNFGGFVTNKIGAKVNTLTHTFHPPMKQVSFNTHLKHNDGLLANYIASVENISFENANKQIANTIANWQKTLTTSVVEIASVGTLQLNNEKQLVFEPNSSSNLLTEAFGLQTIETPEIKRFKQEVKPLTPIVSQKEKKKIVPIYAKYAASVAVLAMLGLAGFNAINKQNQQKEFAKQKQAQDLKIQQATFVIDTPLPTINLNVEKTVSGNYHIVAGAFEFQENAYKKLHQLKAKGFKNARVIGKNKWGLTQVTYTSVADKYEALSELRNVKKTVSKDAWLLVEELD